MSKAGSTFQFACGVSDQLETIRAINDVCDQIASELNQTVDIAFIFLTTGHIDQIELIVETLKKRLSPTHLIGATTQGVVGSGSELQHCEGLCVLAGHLPEVVVKPFFYEPFHWPAILNDPKKLQASMAIDPDQLRGFVLLADPFSTPIVKLLPAFNQAFKGMPITGSMASSANDPGDNRLLIDDKVFTQGVVGLALSGNVQIHSFVSQGCRPLHKPYIITKAKRHIVQELGGKQALKVAQTAVESLSPEDQKLVTTNGILFGRVINEYKQHFGRGDFLIRSLLGYDREAGYIAINDPQIRIGQTMQFHVHEKQTAIEDLHLLLEAQKLYNTNCAALVFLSKDRGVDLFSEPNANVNLIAQSLGDIPLAGFFTDNEFGPIGDENFMHSHTASIMILRPSDQSSNI